MLGRRPGGPADDASLCRRAPEDRELEHLRVVAGNLFHELEFHELEFHELEYCERRGRGNAATAGRSQLIVPNTSVGRSA